MAELQAFAEGPGVFVKILTALAIGLLLGLQRERTPSAKAGLRTFALVAIFGTVTGLIADAVRSSWIVPAGLILVGAMIIAAYFHSGGTPEVDSGTTTVIALMLCYGLGVMVWYGQGELAAAIGIVATALLHFKPELHGLSEKLSRDEVASILEFAVLSFVILPLVPDRGFGPYGVLNPYHIWLMVVLVSGMSLAGYLALRFAGAKNSVLLVGALGGLVSSTATTLVYARQGRLQPETIPVDGGIVVTANLTVLARIAAICAVVAPGALPAVLPVLACGLVAGAFPLALRLRAARDPAAFHLPELSNPTQVHLAIGFGVIYAIVLVGSAWLTDRAGQGGLYAMALASGAVDIDAITLSSLNLFNGGKAAAATAATAIALAYGVSVACKFGLLLVAGGRALLRDCALALLAPIGGVAAGLLLFVR